MLDAYYQLYQKNFPNKAIFVYQGELDADYHDVDMVIFDHARVIDDAGVKVYVGVVDTVLLIDHPRAKMAKGNNIKHEAAGYLYNEVITRGVSIFTNNKNVLDVMCGRLTIEHNIDDDAPEIQEVQEAAEEPESSTTLPPKSMGFNITGQEETMFPPEDWEIYDDLDDDWK